MTALDPEEDDLLDLDPDGHGIFAPPNCRKDYRRVPGAKIVSVRVELRRVGSKSDEVADLRTSDQILSKQAEGETSLKAQVLLALGAPVGVRSCLRGCRGKVFTRDELVT